MKPNDKLGQCKTVTASRLYFREEVKEHQVMDESIAKSIAHYFLKLLTITQTNFIRPEAYLEYYASIGPQEGPCN